MKTQLSIEESARLIELGVDAKMASTICLDFNGTYAYVSGDEKDTVQDCVNGEYYTQEPTVFTLTDLLSILPKSYFSEEYYAEMTLCIEVLNGKWFVNYRCYCGGELAAQDVEKEAPELIDALNQLAIWCLTEKGINLNQNKE